MHPALSPPCHCKTSLTAIRLKNAIESPVGYACFPTGSVLAAVAAFAATLSAPLMEQTLIIAETLYVRASMNCDNEYPEEIVPAGRLPPVICVR